jgi:hypothetical protein
VPLRLARESDSLVFAVGAGARSLAELTAITGGGTIPAEGGDLQAAFARVLHELRTRYLLRVTPHSTKPGWHDVSVRVRSGDAEVRARPGYWRPGKKEQR